jgi:hypothetical protein
MEQAREYETPLPAYPSEPHVPRAEEVEIIVDLSEAGEDKAVAEAETETETAPDEDAEEPGLPARARGRGRFARAAVTADSPARQPIAASPTELNPGSPGARSSRESDLAEFEFEFEFE